MLQSSTHASAVSESSLYVSFRAPEPVEFQETDLEMERSSPSWMPALTRAP